MIQLTNDLMGVIGSNASQVSDRMTSLRMWCNQVEQINLCSGAASASASAPVERRCAAATMMTVIKLDGSYLAAIETSRLLYIDS